jgi:hypothetical protein
MTMLAELIGRTPRTWPAGIEHAIFETDDPVAVARRIEDFVRERLVAVQHAIFYRPGVGVVAGLGLVDGSRVVVKVHRWNVTIDRLVTVQRVQAHLADAGLPAPRPVATPEPLGHGIATVEALIAGETADARQASIRRSLAVGLHDVFRAAADLAHVDGLGDPLVLRDIDAPLWPEPHDVHFDFEATSSGAEWIDDLAETARRRLQDVSGERHAGHFDWRVENVGFIDGRLAAIYDWDSLAAAPEAVVVGAAAAQFTADWTRGHPDPLPSLSEMRSFIEDYVEVRGGGFSPRESEHVDASNLALCAYGARCQHSDRIMAPGISGGQDVGWLRLLRQRGERWFVG